VTEHAANVIAVGTRKGVFVFKSEDGRRSWKAGGQGMPGSSVHHAVYDPRNSAIFAAANYDQWGTKVMVSRDLGASWKEARTGPRFPKESGLSVNAIWHIEPGNDGEPQKLYAGVDPAALFVSDDAGETWEPVGGLVSHPDRPKWTPGFGGLCLHSILVDPRDPRSLHVGISAVGVMHSADGGETWSYQNRHVRADFMPDKFPVFGQCTHKLVRHASRPDVLFQMNHCGVYRSDDNGSDWVDIVDNLPSRFGFPMALDHTRPSRPFVFPLTAAENRVPPEGRPGVWALERQWVMMSRGLQSPAYYGVYREGMSTDKEDPCGVYFGTNTGQLFASADGGTNWSKVTDGLPPILSVTASAV
jgi:BNR/Asp-box repeat